VPELLKFGGDVEVVAPEALRTEVVRTLQAMNRTYGV
jgi:predicted DNA-binding transcriptional regulator YafY